MAKFNLETCICCVILGFLIALLTICNCNKNISKLSISASAVAYSCLFFVQFSATELSNRVA